MVYVCNYTFFYAFPLYDSIFPQAVVLGIFTFLRRRIVVVALKHIIKAGAQSGSTAPSHFAHGHIGVAQQQTGCAQNPSQVELFLPFEKWVVERGNGMSDVSY